MMRPGSHSLAMPIDAVMPALRRALSSASSAVLQAPPGAGKTTGVPIALLQESWLAGQRIIVLEPRRLAARAAARRLAVLLGEAVGGTVGFRVRGETRVGRATRIEIVTEGVLTRMLLTDPALEGVGLVVFDEFHERSVHADLGLALTLESQSVLRPELRVLVMSATLDGETISSLLDGAPIVTSEGRAFPVEVRFSPPRAGQSVEGAMASTIRRALEHDDGSLLAFLPGVGEITRVATMLDGDLLPGVSIHRLFGDLSPREQDAAVLPAAPGCRKVVLATSIAETSLTIEGIRVVVDGGLARASRFSPRSGMARLETVRVSRASADQRCGRAGRTAPGICYRLWSVSEQAALLERATPEILVTDLAPLALDLAVAGVVDPASLRWLDAPPPGALGQARELLIELGAIDASFRITPHGRAMAALGAHPRLAHLLLEGRARGAASTACALAALLEERDLFQRDTQTRDADVRSRLHAVGVAGDRDPRVAADRLRRIRERSDAWRAALRAAPAPVDEDAAGWLLALAYPDRIARRREGAGHRFLLRSGRGARLDEAGALGAAPWLAVADTDGQLPEARVFLAAPIALADIVELFRAQVTTDEVVEWDRTAGLVAARRRERLGALVLRDVAGALDEDVAMRVLLSAIERNDGVQLPWDERVSRVSARMAFLRHLDSSWPDWSEATLRASLDQWLLPHLAGLRRRSQVESLDLASVLLSTLSVAQRQAVDRLAPSHLEVPTGSRIAVDYADAEAPFIAVRLQELFGLAETPRLGAGRVPVVLQLLSPAGRPVQVTRDLAGFWRSSYFEVRRDLRGRYPRHEWPDDPLAAAPTRRAKRRK